VAPDVEDVDDARVRARDRLELPHPVELPLVGALAREAAAPDDLHRAQLPRRASCEPDPAVAPRPHRLQDLAIRPARRRAGSRGGRARRTESHGRFSTTRASQPRDAADVPASAAAADAASSPSREPTTLIRSSEPSPLLTRFGPSSVPR